MYLATTTSYILANKQKNKLPQIQKSANNVKTLKASANKPVHYCKNSKNVGIVKVILILSYHFCFTTFAVTGN